MKRLILYITVLMAAVMPLSAVTAAKDNVAVTEAGYTSLYNRLGINNVVSYKAFEQAMQGRSKISGIKKDNLLVVIDFSKPSTDERLCVIDLGNETVLFRSHVAHGRNSGSNYATSFSNKPGSYQSSLGFYLTENTYQGKNGYSLRLNGLEKGINDKAKERAIVIHGSSYCNPSVIKSNGRLGRSLGCPALPTALNKPIIDTIKDGTLIYIYADNDSYISSSPILS